MAAAGRRIASSHFYKLISRRVGTKWILAGDIVSECRRRIDWLLRPKSFEKIIYDLVFILYTFEKGFVVMCEGKRKRDEELLRLLYAISKMCRYISCKLKFFDQERNFFFFYSDILHINLNSWVGIRYNFLLESVLMLSSG